jgi:hypothetical protein
VRPTRKAWIVWAVAWAFLAMLDGVVVVGLLLRTRWWDAFLAALGAQTAYWFALGGWLRTPWGQPHLDEYATPNPTPISDRVARAYIAAAIACAAAVTSALGYQWLSTR